MRLAGLAPWFQSVVTFDDVARAKPAPDAYLLSAERLNAAPARCLAFEDSETGARSAHDAGMIVVQVPDIPRTISGKITELAVRNLIHGKPVKNTDALANPASLDFYRKLPELQQP